MPAWIDCFLPPVLGGNILTGPSPVVAPEHEPLRMHRQLLGSDKEAEEPRVAGTPVDRWQLPPRQVMGAGQLNGTSR